MVITSLRNRHLLAWDAAFMALAPFVAYTLRYEGFNWTGADVPTSIIYTVIALILKLGIFIAFGLYGRLWRHANVSDMETIVATTGTSALICSILGIIVLPYSGLTEVRVPISVVFMDGFFTVAIVTAPRLGIKALSTWYRKKMEAGRRALIAGAGGAGEMVLKELLKHPEVGLVPVGFVDDDRTKHNHRLGGYPVLGGLGDIWEIVEREKIEEVIIAMPRAPGHVVRSVVRAAARAKVPTRTVPGLAEIVSGRVKVGALRKVEIQDLLRREAVKTDLEAVSGLVQDRTVLITGAGGSIGSELCRQVAVFGPRRMVLLGNAENEIFEIQQELRVTHPELATTSVIADVRNGERLRDHFGRYQPHTVFHAAAHKHVPLMETNVAEAVTNNVLGTRNVIDCSVQWGVERFVLISTDKAVRPVNIMGATKRAAEMLLQEAVARHGRNFVSVRFGNVLGSRGSVVPTFLKQIHAGGPVTITHPEMRRYFMTIPEAVQLVLQASTLGEGGELFALDMGEPVRIVDLAADLIRLSGLEVGTDIEIKFTGVRPGERLYEEVFFRGEDVVPTEHPKVLRSRSNNLPQDLRRRVDALIKAAQKGNDEDVRVLLRWVVPEFHPESSAGAPERRAIPAPRWSRRRMREGAPRPVPVSERRSGSDRRAEERRSELNRLGRLAQFMGKDQRVGLDRRSGIDRRSPVPAHSDTEMGATA